MEKGPNSNVATPKTKKKTIITEEQEQVIRRLQSEGLHGTGKKYHRLLNQAVRETGLPLPIVCRKVHNMRRGKKSRKQLAAPARKHMYARRLSGYNLFCHVTGSQSSDGTLRQQIWGQRWAALTKEEQLVYITRAEAMNNTPLSDLQGEQKQAAINISTAAIIYHMERLQTLQPGHGLFIYTDTKTFVSSACGTGYRVLSDKEVELQTELSKGFEVQVETSSAAQHREYLRKAVQTKMTESYGQYLGKQGSRRFPYSAYTNGETDFLVKGLPEGFVLQKACMMNVPDMQTVLDSTLTYVPRPTDCMETSPVSGDSFDGDTSGRSHASNQVVSTEGTSCLSDASVLTIPSSPPAPTNSSVTPDEMEITSPGLVEHLPVEYEDSTLIETTTYEFSVSQDSLVDEATTSLQYDVIPVPTNGEQSSKNDDIVTVPHLSPKEAMEAAQKLAKAMEERKSNRRSSRSNDRGQSILDFLLGKTVSELWTVKNKGKRNSKEWYTGTIVQNTLGEFAIKFDDEEELYPLSARKAANGIKKGTLHIVQANASTN